MNSVSKLSFQIEVKRVLEILSNDIYDSPYALLRENIQNGYDAILMRKEEENDDFEGKIIVEISNTHVSIRDNGIGMNRDVVSNNFWKAGSSGKNNEAAKKAGVVGTFGIGAMANFGVSKSLKVITHFFQGNETIESFALRENLSITEECIEVSTYEENREPGTEVIVELDPSIQVKESEAIKYLEPYVKYLNVPVLINGKNISQRRYLDFFEVQDENIFAKEKIAIEENNFKFQLHINFTKQNQIKILCDKIFKNDEMLKGEIALSQGNGNVYGLRNYFGLAPVPLSGFFNLGGIVNLSALHPTAGREALSRDSIELVTQIVNISERKVAESISKLDLADTNGGFLNYISHSNKFDLAGKIKIEVRPGDDRWELNKIKPQIDGKKVYYYSGRDPQIILAFGNENTYLLLLSQENPRRKIQQEFIRRQGVEEVPNKATVLNKYEIRDLSNAEMSLILRITNTLTEDYLIGDSRIIIADISHEVPSLVEHKDNILTIFLSRQSSAVKQVLQIYESDWQLFPSFVKDFIRNHLYQKFSSYVPSSTKQGADALHKILMRNRELYKYEFSDLGEIESLMSDYVHGDIDFGDVLKKSFTITSGQTQYFYDSNVGTVEQEIPSIIEHQTNEDIDELAPLPPILRREETTTMKILKTDKQYKQLNNFTLFLSLSEKVFKSQQEFFFEPHTTKVIWSMHRVVYIFTHASNQLSLYYDIELKEKLKDESTGGKPIATTTIVMGNRIFIPIPHDLLSYFDIKEGAKEFYVRHDLIADFTQSS